MWSHAKTEARVVARDTAALVARSAVPTGDAEASATAILEADTDLRNVAVTATSAAGIVTVTSHGRRTRHHPGNVDGSVGHVGRARSRN